MNETEAKYDAPVGTALPHLDALPQVAGTSGPDEEQLEAEYYDTADLRLMRAGITLRRRRGGHDQGWHLKLPAGLTPAARSGCRSAAVAAGCPPNSPTWSAGIPAASRSSPSPG